MAYEYWQQQKPDQPLFSDIIWNKPQQKIRAGKLLIVGGNLHSIAAAGEAYETAIKQGVGDSKVVLPDATRKLLGGQPPLGIEFAESTPSGSFSSKAEAAIKSYISSADATLFAGDFSHSSETAILLERLVKIPGLQVYSGDSTDYFLETPYSLLLRRDTLLVLSFAELQKYALKSRFKRPFTSNMELLQLVDTLHEFTVSKPSIIASEHRGCIIIASGGQIISSQMNARPESWRTKTAAAAAVWWLQNPTKGLQAVATAVSQQAY